MQICDFSRSFFHLRIDITGKEAITVSQPAPWTMNRVRMPIEALCRITREGVARDYLLGSPCKAEQVYVRRDVWHDPNADVSIIMSDDAFLIIKSWDHCGRRIPLHPAELGFQPARHVGSAAEAYDEQSMDLHMVEGRELTDSEQVIEAGLANSPLVSRTRWTQPDGAQVLIEYPVKCCNFGEREKYYQVDTGPILLPNPDRPHESDIETLELAYVAHNSPGWAEFIVNVPTAIAEGVEVDHYAQSRRMENVVNTMVALP